MKNGIAEQTNYCPFCEDCDWTGREYDNEEAAQEDLEDHRREKHGVDS